MKSVELKAMHPDVLVPTYGSPGAAAFDLRAYFEDGNPRVLASGQTLRIPTGVAIWIKDKGYALCLWERSGLAAKGIAVGGGLCDSDYQGEIQVVLRNLSDEPFTVSHQDRIAQATLTRVEQVSFELVTEFSDASTRGRAGFGSTGVA